MTTKHKRATMTARQLAEDYLTHQITRDVTRTSTRYHLNQLLALFGGWQARRGGRGPDAGVFGRPEGARRHGHHSAPPRPAVAYRPDLGRGDGPPACVASGRLPAASSQGSAHRSAHASRGCAHVQNGRAAYPACDRPGHGRRAAHRPQRAFQARVGGRGTDGGLHEDAQRGQGCEGRQQNRPYSGRYSAPVAGVERGRRKTELPVGHPLARTTGALHT